MTRARLCVVLLVPLLMLAGLTVGVTRLATSSSDAPRSAQRVHVGHADEQGGHGARPPVDANATNPRIYDLPHGNHVDAYWTPRRHNVPWIVFVHGGYWSFGYAYTESTKEWGQHERARGFAAFSIDYRLVPHARWPTPLTDVETAIAWIRAHARQFGLDPARGFIVGHSAGGLMSSIAALQTGDFIGALDLAGAVDPLTEFETAPDLHLRSAALALMGDRLPTDDPRRWETARAATWIGRHRCAFLIMQSRGDLTVPFASSTEFAAALRKQYYPVTLLPLPGSDHELDTWRDLLLEDRWTDEVLRSTTR